MTAARARSPQLSLGAGGLGSPVALYLAAAGIGRIGLVDDDAVSLSNLQRQILFRTADVGRAKVDAGADTLKALSNFSTRTGVDDKAFSNLKNYHYYMHIKTDGVDFQPNETGDFKAHMAGKNLVYDFSVTLPKPAQAIEKIVAGMLDKFFQTYTLLDQGFVKKNSEISVKEHVAQVSKQLGDEIQIRRFVRFQVGESV